MSLKAALRMARELLSPILNSADLVIDTSKTSIYELRELLREIEAHDARTNDENIHV